MPPCSLQRQRYIRAQGVTVDTVQRVGALCRGGLPYGVVTGTRIVFASKDHPFGTNLTVTVRDVRHRPRRPAEYEVAVSVHRRTRGMDGTVATPTTTATTTEASSGGAAHSIIQQSRAWHRYNDFRALAALIKDYGSRFKLPSLPRKTLFKSFDASFLETRRRQLAEWLREVFVRYPELLCSPQVWQRGGRKCYPACVPQWRCVCVCV